MSNALHNHMPRARGRERDIKTAAYRRFVDDERPIVTVSRRRFDVVYKTADNKNRFITIRLARVAGYFEQKPFKEQGS
ncbi:hypothetical protein [Methylocystis sp.]|uniref:hypothetical protein n=1 Tax=Methylocystis sp. TaxID=1911079 RepID=UPI002733820B|nr:hypothetical protein [Methylocystis sp.]MDP3554857.1 hypothetical protein [Methylocystis sp.]